MIDKPHRKFISFLCVSNFIFTSYLYWKLGIIGQTYGTGAAFEMLPHFFFFVFMIWFLFSAVIFYARRSKHTKYKI